MPLLPIFNSVKKEFEGKSVKLSVGFQEQEWTQMMECLSSQDAGVVEPLEEIKFLSCLFSGLLLLRPTEI